MKAREKAILAKAAIRRQAEERIKAAAIVAFASKGMHGATISEIAASIGMPTATVHYYFKNKSDLYDAVLEQIVDLWFSEIAGIDGIDEPLIEIESYVRSKLEFSRLYPNASRIFANDILGGNSNILDKIKAHIRPLVEEKCVLIQRWVDQGSIRPIDPMSLFFMIWGCTEFYANFAAEISVFTDRPDMSDEQYEAAVKTTVDVIVNGCKPVSEALPVKAARKRSPAKVPGID